MRNYKTQKFLHRIQKQGLAPLLEADEAFLEAFELAL